MPRPYVVAYITCALIWGTTWFAIRVSIAPGTYPTVVALALRFVIASLLLVPFALRARPLPTGRQWGWLALSGALGATGYLFVYRGEERVSGAVAAVVNGTQPLILAIVLSIVRVEKLTRRHMIGAAVSLIGVATLFLDRLEVSPSQGIGVMLVLGSVVAATVYSTIMKRHAGGVHAVVSTTVTVPSAATTRVGSALMPSRRPCLTSTTPTIRSGPPVDVGSRSG